jgi:predicted RNase H-like HicB family nuclease/uncharacterized damage-inducible protein DinB
VIDVLVTIAGDGRRMRRGNSLTMRGGGANEMAKKTYDLYVESGPKRRTTMVHVPALLGCVATGPTTDDALAATLDAIRAYRGFMRAHGDDSVGEDDPFETRVVEHITQGEWLGNGSPYIVFAPDLKPVTAPQIATFLRRFHALRETLAAWSASLSDAELDATPGPRGRTARAILLHVLPGPGNYLSASVGGVTGFSRLQTEAERGQRPIPDALRQAEAMASEIVWATTPEQRRAIIERPKDVRTLAKALRRTLEHDWEHVAELSRRPGGPVLGGGK